MEAAAATATIVTLVVAAQAASRIAHGLIKSIEEAPKEIEAVALNLQLISNTLEQILALRPLMERNHEQLVPLGLRIVLATTLQNAQSSLLSLKRIYQSVSGHSNIHSRLRWAVLDKYPVSKILGRMREIEFDLMLILQTINIHISLINQASVGAITTAQDTLLKQMGPLGLLQEGKQGSQCCNGSEIGGHVEPRSLPSRAMQKLPIHNDPDIQLRSTSKGANFLVTQETPCSSLCTVEFLTVSATIIYIQNAKCSTYALKVTSRMLEFLCRKALVLEMTVCRNIYSLAQISLLHGSFGFYGTVPCISPLMTASENGDLDTVKEILETKRGNPNDRRGNCSCIDGKHRRFQDETSLHPAIRSGNIDLVRYFLAQGADVNSLGFELRSPLQLAFSSGFLDIARLLASKGACLQHVDYYGCSVLHSLLESSLPYNAVGSRNWEDDICIPALIYLASMSFDYFDTPNAYGSTALHLSAACGLSYEIWNTLLRYGSRLQTAERSGIILRDAARGGSYEVLRYIMENGNRAVWKRPRRSNPTALCTAVFYGKVACVAGLLEYGADPNEIDCCTFWPLHVAIRSANLDIIRLLLEYGADVDQRDHKGHTPLHVAMIEDDPCLSAELINILLYNGADPDVRGIVCFDELKQSAMDESHDRLGGQLTPWETTMMAGNNSINEHLSALKGFHPEVTIDNEDGVFWDALESIPAIGMGGSYEYDLGRREEPQKKLYIKPDKSLQNS